MFVYFSLGDQYYSLDSKSLFFEHFLLEEELDPELSGFLCCEDGGKSSSVTTEKPGWDSYPGGGAGITGSASEPASSDTLIVDGINLQKNQNIFNSWSN